MVSWCDQQKRSWTAESTATSSPAILHVPLPSLPFARRGAFMMDVVVPDAPRFSLSSHSTASGALTAVHLPAQPDASPARPAAKPGLVAKYADTAAQLHLDLEPASDALSEISDLSDGPDEDRAAAVARRAGMLRTIMRKARALDEQLMVLAELKGVKAAGDGPDRGMEARPEPEQEPAPPAGPKDAEEQSLERDSFSSRAASTAMLGVRTTQTPQLSGRLGPLADPGQVPSLALDAPIPKLPDSAPIGQGGLATPPKTPKSTEPRADATPLGKLSTRRGQVPVLFLTIDSDTAVPRLQTPSLPSSSARSEGQAPSPEPSEPESADFTYPTAGDHVSWAPSPRLPPIEEEPEDEISAVLGTVYSLYRRIPDAPAVKPGAGGGGLKKPPATPRGPRSFPFAAAAASPAKAVEKEEEPILASLGRPGGDPQAADPGEWLEDVPKRTTSIGAMLSADGSVCWRRNDGEQPQGAGYEEPPVVASVVRLERTGSYDPKKDPLIGRRPAPTSSVISSPASPSGSSKMPGAAVPGQKGVGRQGSGSSAASGKHPETLSDQQPTREPKTWCLFLRRRR